MALLGALLQCNMIPQHRCSHQALLRLRLIATSSFHSARCVLVSGETFIATVDSSLFSVAETMSRTCPGECERGVSSCSPGHTTSGLSRDRPQGPVGAYDNWPPPKAAGCCCCCCYRPPPHAASLAGPQAREPLLPLAVDAS